MCYCKSKSGKKSRSLSIRYASSKLKYGGFGIGIITLLGASIALMNIMLVSVTERTQEKRTQEIGIRKALGATPSRIRQQFLIEAIVICILGGIAGLILAMAFGNVVSQLLYLSSTVLQTMYKT